MTQRGPDSWDIRVILGKLSLGRLPVILFATVIGLSSFSGIAANASAQSFETYFENGNKAYEGRDYARALAAYDSALATGQESGALYFNRGNALFKQGQLASAIVNYLRAERYIPGDPDLAANLAIARSHTRVQLVGDSLMTFDRTLEQTVGRIHLNTFVWWTTVLFVLLMLVLTLRFGLAVQVAVLRPLSLLFGLCFLLGVLGTSARQYLDYGRQRGVVTGEGTVLTGPTVGSDIELTASPGLVVHVLDHSGDYLQVRFDNLRQGWIEKKFVELL